MALANVQLIEELRQSNRRKDEFLAMLAHELRNPLAPLHNALNVLRLGSHDLEAVPRAHEIMSRQLRHLTQIVDELLDVSRLERGTVCMCTERVDLAELVRQSQMDYADLFRQAGISFEAQLPGAAVWLEGDATRLAQVLGNLLDNAVKFTPQGGAVALQLAVDSAKREAVIGVRDTGIGISPELLPQVFEVFAQAERPLDRSQGGLGLGLSIARRLVLLHGGTIEACSEGLGRGAEFLVRLPCTRELAAVSKQAIETACPAARLRVLVVEDNRDSAETMRILLELFGHEVSVAYDGQQGVELAKAVRPAVVLCDIGLPVMDGLAVASALRQDPATAETRLIAVTGYGGEDDRQKTLAAGFDVHLVKPVDAKVLKAQIELSCTPG
jgi:CheY-like chemotaxis protein